MKSFAAEGNGGQGKKFPALAVSGLVSFAPAVSEFTSFTDSDSRDTDEDRRDSTFSPA